MKYSSTDAISMFHGIATCRPLCFCQFISSKNRHLNMALVIVGADYTHLSCTLNSSSMSSSSQLSSHSLSPPDFAAPGAAPPRCARSVSESSQSKRDKLMQGRGKDIGRIYNLRRGIPQTRHLLQELQVEAVLVSAAQLWLPRVSVQRMKTT